jgi:transposase
VPYEESSKKRKVTGEKKAKKTVGTVIGHYFNFIANTLDVFDRHKHFKGCYLVMDNAPIHNSVQIERLVVRRDYGCVYLPPYSPELNPIEQFWSVVKSRMKRERMLSEETLASRVTDACNKIYLKDLQGFCRHSHSNLEVCLNKNLFNRLHACANKFQEVSNLKILFEQSFFFVCAIWVSVSVQFKSEFEQSISGNTVLTILTIARWISCLKASE